MTETIGLQVQIRNPANQQETWYRFTSASAPGVEDWDRRIADGGVVTFSKIVFDGRQLLNGVVPTVSVVTLDNSDAALDTILAHEWKARPAQLDYFTTTGGVTNTFTGTVTEIEYDLSRIRVALSNDDKILRNNVQLNLYAGTGAEEGSDTLKDKTKPRIFGTVYQVEPVTIDPVVLTYHVHDGALTPPNGDILAVRDGGLPLLLDTNRGVNGNFDTYADLITNPNAPRSGYYTTWLDGGMIRLGVRPVYVVTVDAMRNQPDEIGTATDIIKEILSERGATIFIESFNEANLKGGNGKSGYYFGTSPVSVEAAITELIQGVFGYWYVLASGAYGVRLFDAISGAIAEDLTGKFALPTMISRVAKVTPPSRIGILYRRNWRVLTATEIAPSVPAADYNAFQASGLTVAYVTTDPEASADIEYPSAILEFADATALTARINAFYTGVRRIIQIEVARETPLSSDLGQIVRLSITIGGQGRLRLANKNFEVFGVEELLGQGRARLTIGGPE